MEKERGEGGGVEVVKKVEMEGLSKPFEEEEELHELQAFTFSFQPPKTSIHASSNPKEEVDPNALEREVESAVEEESRHDEDEFEEDDEDDAELNISSASNDEYRYIPYILYGTWRTESDGFHVRRPRVRVPVHDRDCLPVHVGRPGDRDCLPVHASRPGDRDRLPVNHASSATFPFFLTTGYMGKIDPGSASRYITTLVHAHIPVAQLTSPEGG
ncbi:hypothetical protein Taro_054193 [Colocasia esculenta]|uniref:Uncharacterized protein n=1 Tax=Colocasia esculenta TaxID=4460 RepID=A0A843XN81_COLES|nr:hypothetical protein [Colocasia esculenta]